MGPTLLRPQSSPGSYTSHTLVSKNGDAYPVFFRYLGQNFIAVKEHHVYGNSYTKQHSIGASLQSQRISLLSIIIQGSWQHPGQHGAIAAESSTSWSRVSKMRLCATLGVGELKACSNIDTFFPARSHLLKKWPYLLVVPLLMDQAFKHVSLWEPLLVKPPHSIRQCPQTCIPNIMQNSFSLISQVSIVYYNLNNIYNSKVQSLF